MAKKKTMIQKIINLPGEEFIVAPAKNQIDIVFKGKKRGIPKRRRITK